MHFRNTDWPSYNMAGRISILIERKIGKQEHSRILSFPLCTGAEYGENKHGLTLSINVSPGALVLNPKGLPAFCLYRHFLQTCSSVADVKEKILNDPTSQPIGPCQLTLSDEKDGAIVRFYQLATGQPDELDTDRLTFQGKHGYVFTHDVSELNSETPVLVVANEGLGICETGVSRGNHHDSAQRSNNVYCTLLDNLNPALAKSRFSVQDAHRALQAPIVMNCESVHTIIKKGGTSYVGLSNGYSARFFPVAVGALGGKGCISSREVDALYYAPAS